MTEQSERKVMEDADAEPQGDDWFAKLCRAVKELESAEAEKSEK